MTEGEMIERITTYAKSTLVQYGERVSTPFDFKVDPYDPYVEFTFFVEGDKFPYYGCFRLSMDVLKEIFCDD